MLDADGRAAYADFATQVGQYFSVNDQLNQFVATGDLTSVGQLVPTLNASEQASTEAIARAVLAGADAARDTAAGADDLADLPAEPGTHRHLDPPARGQERTRRALSRR